MSPIQANVSFEKRRELMKKVEHMVAEAEALSKKKDWREDEVHVSDASSCESEGEFTDIENLSPILHLRSDKSFPQESPRSFREVATPRFENRGRIIPRLALNDEIELEALSASPLDKPQNQSELSSIKLDRTVTSAGVISAPSSTRSTATSFNFCKEGPVESASKPDLSTMSLGKSEISTPSSVASRNFYKGGPVHSVCSNMKPEQSTSSTGKSISSKLSSINSAATPLTIYQGVPVNSPPFLVESPVDATPESVVAPTTSTSYKTLLDMKKEISDLTAQFENMEKRTMQYDINASCEKNDFENAEKAFEEGVDIMARKTDAVIDALHKNLSRSRIIQQDNDKLRSHIQYLKKNHGTKSTATTSRYTEGMCLENQENLLQADKCVNHFDPSDEYLKRRYPAVPTTPGTMFVSEIVEVLNLDVGDHIYLSRIMDKQWGSMIQENIPS